MSTVRRTVQIVELALNCETLCKIVYIVAIKPSHNVHEVRNVTQLIN